MQSIDDIDVTLDLDGVQGLVFTSANAVRSFARRWARRDMLAWCVGAGTASAAQAAGFQTRAAQGDVTVLANVLAQQAPQSLLYLHGTHRAGDLVSLLAQSGHHLRSAAIYDQRAVPLDDETLTALRAGKIEAIALFSPRSAQLLLDKRQDWPQLRCFCMSMAVANAAAPLGPCVIAEGPNAAAMLALIGKDPAWG